MKECHGVLILLSVHVGIVLFVKLHNNIIVFVQTLQYVFWPFSPHLASAKLVKVTTAIIFIVVVCIDFVIMMTFTSFSICLNYE